MLFCRDAIFVAILRTFRAYHLQTKKRGGVQKTTNIRYGLIFQLNKKSADQNSTPVPEPFPEHDCDYKCCKNHHHNPSDHMS